MTIPRSGDAAADQETSADLGVIDAGHSAKLDGQRESGTPQSDAVTDETRQAEPADGSDRADAEMAELYRRRPDLAARERECVARALRQSVERRRAAGVASADEWLQTLPALASDAAMPQHGPH